MIARVRTSAPRRLLLTAIAIVTTVSLTQSAFSQTSDAGGESDAADAEMENFEIVSPQHAATRSLCISAVIMRGLVEQWISEDPGSVDDFAEQAESLNEWLVQQGLWESLSQDERASLSKAPGEFTQQEIVNASWRAESLAVLLWSLGITETIPDFDEEAEVVALVQNVPFLDETGTFIRDATLRDSDALQEGRNLAELWHWRARTYQIQQDPDRYPIPEGVSLDEVVQMAARFAEEEGLFKAIDDDFPVLGKPFRQLDEDEYQYVRSISSERHYAMNWICGYAEDWDDVPTDT